MFGVVWDYYSSKLKGKQYQQNTTPKSYKTELKIIANPELAQLSFEQPGPELQELHQLQELQNYKNYMKYSYCNKNYRTGTTGTKAVLVTLWG